MQNRFIGWMTLGSALAFGLALSVSIGRGAGRDGEVGQERRRSQLGLQRGHVEGRSGQAQGAQQAARGDHQRKYPASKAEVVAHVKGIKADDKKWFEETLPDRTYGSADEVMSALGWETAASADNDDKPAPAHSKSSKAGASSKKAQDPGQVTAAAARGRRAARRA